MARARGAGLRTGPLRSAMRTPTAAGCGFAQCDVVTPRNSPAGSRICCGLHALQVQPSRDTDAPPCAGSMRALAQPWLAARAEGSFRRARTTKAVWRSGAACFRKSVRLRLVEHRTAVYLGATLTGHYGDKLSIFRLATGGAMERKLAAYGTTAIRGFPRGTTSPICAAETPDALRAFSNASPSGVEMSSPPAVWGS